LLFYGFNVRSFFPVSYRHLPYLFFTREVVVDHAEAASSSFAASWVSPAKLPKSSRSRHNVAKLPRGGKPILPFPVLVVSQIVGEVASKCRSLKEFHPVLSTPLAYTP